MAEQAAELLRRAGARVRAARRAAGISQDQLAARIGMARSSVANLEAGRQDMTLSRLAGIAAILDLDLAALVSVSDLRPARPEPHDVIIRPALEVTCHTCGGLVLDVTRDRAQARESKATHIAAMREAGASQ